MSALSKIPITSELVSGLLERSEQVITRTPNKKIVYLDKFEELLCRVNEFVVGFANFLDVLLRKHYLNSEESTLKVDNVYELGDIAFIVHPNGKVEPIEKEDIWFGITKFRKKLDLMIARQKRNDEMKKLENQLEIEKRWKEEYRSLLPKIPRLWKRYEITEDYLVLKVPKLYTINGLNVILKPNATIEIVDEENLEAKRKELEIEGSRAIERREKEMEVKKANEPPKAKEKTEAKKKGTWVMIKRGTDRVGKKERVRLVKRGKISW
ncbi:MAG: hypothetical protein ACTSXC_07480 [Candidatus Freyarchaeota archaeon]